jgi:hypothetical protein
VYAVDSQGFGDCCGFRMLNSSRGSYIRVVALTVFPVDVARNGLKVSVIGESGLSSMVIFAEPGFPPPLELPPVEPPHAAVPNASARAIETPPQILARIA